MMAVYDANMPGDMFISNSNAMFALIVILIYQDCIVFIWMGSNYEYLALYMASFFIIAISMSCLGTLIPFLAEDQGI